MILDNILDFFDKKYQSDPAVIIQSPGRINIIGEHTDYNDGFVLPAAINHYICVSVSKNDERNARLYAIDLDEDHITALDAVRRTDKSWVNLINGVLAQLADSIGGVNLAFGGNIPSGAGVSSSAAICCGVTMALSELYDLNLSRWEVAKIAQKSEHEYALVQCGIMDQFACMFGLTNHVLLLNCLTKEYKESEIDLHGNRFLLIDSKVEHSLGDSDYNRRKLESEEALNFLKTIDESILSYQDVTVNHLDKAKEKLDPVLWKRAFHIVTENQRVHEMQLALTEKKHEQVGELLNQSHHSLKEYYEVTCKETDFLVEELNKQSTIYGARQLGGGFGGCVLAIIKDAEVNNMLKPIENAYKKAFNITLDNIQIKISKGCHRID